MVQKHYILGVLKIKNKKVQEFYFIKMEIPIKGTGSMECLKEKVDTFMKMELYMKDNGNRG